MSDTSNSDRPGFKPPVAWLLGRDLIASLQGTLLYTAFGSKLDPREWMKAKVIEFEETAADEEFWFDYISDSGDGMKATYSIAYLALSNLYVEELLTEMPRADKVSVGLEKKNGHKTLPRGSFLLVGGDTSYHLSDYATLGTRFYQPFRWAFKDLWENLETTGKADDLENLKQRRPIFGIPGNHDYYDQLDGFRRQFHQPTRIEADGDSDMQLPECDDTSVPELMLPGFKRRQDASYVGLKLPFDWWLWGLDTEVGLIDEQQRNFFEIIKKELYENELKKWRETKQGREPQLKDFPKKLIMATCSPTTFFGRFARGDDKKSAESIAQLELPQPFLPKDKKGDEELSARSGDAILTDGQCRLDLSGDYHFYARYWGPPSNRKKPRASDAERPRAASYASVISGLGGAFHHPSQTFRGDLQEQALYPSENVSRRKFSRRLFSFRHVFKGGGVGYIGFCLAFVIYFTATVPMSSKQVVDDALTHFPFGFSPAEHWLNFLLPLVSLILFGGSFFFFPKSGESSRIKNKGEKKEIAVNEDPATQPESPEKPAKESSSPYIQIQKTIGSKWQPIYGGAAVISLVLLLTGLKNLQPHIDSITPFAKSMLVFSTLIWTALAIVLSIIYSEWLFKQASVREIKRRDWGLPWLLFVLSIVAVAAGLLLFGKFIPSAYLAADIILALAVAGTMILIVLLAVLVGGEDSDWKSRLLKFLPLGIWHAVLQLSIPFLYVRMGTWLTLLMAALLITAFWLGGRLLMRHDYRRLLLAAWILYGASMLALPFLTYYLTNYNFNFFSLEYVKPFIADSGAPYSDELILPAIAGIVGLFMSCIWLGWYLAVCLSFGAHNNEAGGAGRVEEFKEFIRFRLTKETLTGFVIAVDEPKKKGAELVPQLVDVFHLKVKRL